MKTRATAAQVLYKVVDQGYSLSSALPHALQQVAAKDRALLQELCFGTLRWLSRLEAIAGKLMNKPLKDKQRPLHFLLLVGLYQLFHTRIPAHAALSETVNGCRLLKADALRGLLNGVLRNAQRQHDELLAAVDKQDVPVYPIPTGCLNALKTPIQPSGNRLPAKTTSAPPCGYG